MWNTHILHVPAVAAESFRDAPKTFLDTGFRSKEKGEICREETQDVWGEGCCIQRI